MTLRRFIQYLIVGVVFLLAIQAYLAITRLGAISWSWLSIPCFIAVTHWLVPIGYRFRVFLFWCAMAAAIGIVTLGVEYVRFLSLEGSFDYSSIHLIGQVLAHLGVGGVYVYFVYFTKGEHDATGT